MEPLCTTEVQFTQQNARMLLVAPIQGVQVHRGLIGGLIGTATVFCDVPASTIGDRPVFNVGYGAPTTADRAAGSIHSPAHGHQTSIRAGSPSDRFPTVVR